MLELFPSTLSLVLFLSIVALNRLSQFLIRKMSPKIININKLSDGKLEIVFTGPEDLAVKEAHKVIVVDRNDFEYGIKNPFPIISGVASLGVWCRV